MSVLCSWVNGEMTTKLDCFDRGLAFGDGVFETLLVDNASIFLLDLHLQRLEKSCSFFSISLDRSVIEKELAAVFVFAQAQRHVQRWRLKIIVTRGSSNSGYASVDDHASHRIFMLTELVVDLQMLKKNGVKTRVCDWTIGRQPQLAGIKHLNRLDQVMARREWQEADIYEGFLKDDQGHLVEGTCSNVFIVSAGKLYTPKLDQAGVEGVMKQFVVTQLCQDLALVCEEVILTSFDQAEEVFITNALIGIVPVISINNKNIPVGLVTQSLQRAFLRHLECCYEN